MSPTASSTSPALMDERQAAAYLSLSAKTLYNLRCRGELPFVRVGKRVLYSQTALDQWIADRMTTAS